MPTRPETPAMIARRIKAEKQAADGAVAMAEHLSDIETRDEQTAKLRALRLALDAELAAAATVTVRPLKRKVKPKVRRAPVRR